MRFAYWTREVAGWLLIGGGLWAFWTAYGLLLDKQIFQAGPVVFIGFIVFRGGIHVLKVAVAAQAALTQTDAAQPVTRRVPRAQPRAVGPTPAKSVMPGPKGSRPAPTRG